MCAPMSLRALIRHPKTITDAGEWKTGKMPKTVFPMSKTRFFRLGDGWHWRVVSFTDGKREFRLLVALHEYKQNAYATLGEVVGPDMKVIASAETHSTHPGWHIHANCGLTATVAGRMRDPDMKRIPGKSRLHKPLKTLLIPNDVFARAIAIFRLPSFGYGSPSVVNPSQPNLWPSP